jgi:hypothetical protein
MANNNAPFGFRQNNGTGVTPSFEQVVMLVDYSASAIYNGDPVAHVTDGTVAAGGSLPGTIPIAGIFVGCAYLSVSQKRLVWSNYWGAADVASGNNVNAYIINDPLSQWLAQSSGASGLTQGMLGQAMQFAYGTGSTTTGYSGAYIDASNTNNTATFPFRLMSLVTPVGNTSPTTGEYNQGVFAFNNIETRVTTGAT